jgi:hypothetical protein
MPQRETVSASWLRMMCEGAHPTQATSLHYFEFAACPQGKKPYGNNKLFAFIVP